LGRSVFAENEFLEFPGGLFADGEALVVESAFESGYLGGNPRRKGRLGVGRRRRFVLDGLVGAARRLGGECCKQVVQAAFGEALSGDHGFGRRGLPGGRDINGKILRGKDLFDDLLSRGVREAKGDHLRRRLFQSVQREDYGEILRLEDFYLERSRPGGRGLRRRGSRGEPLLAFAFLEIEVPNIGVESLEIEIPKVDVEVIKIDAEGLDFKQFFLDLLVPERSGAGGREFGGSLRGRGRWRHGGAEYIWLGELVGCILWKGWIRPFQRWKEQFLKFTGQNLVKGRQVRSRGRRSRGGGGLARSQRRAELRHFLQSQATEGA
jgi:hypothetical protein